MAFAHGHHHHHGAHGRHDHAHAHDSAGQDAAHHGRAFLIGISLNVAFVIVETIAGFSANSVALIADAGHNLSDVLGLVVAWAGALMARRLPTKRFTYGLKKASILAALVNALLLMGAIGAIVAEGVRRLFEPSPSNGMTVIIVAALGIVVNGITALLFAGGREHDINIRGAFLHMAADAVVSAGVVIAGLVILRTGQEWIDPLTSIVVALIILWGSLGLLKESVWMTLAGVPQQIDLDEVNAALAGLPGVIAVHDLHVWPLSTTETALTAHLVMPAGHPGDDFLHRAADGMDRQFRIRHATFQVEIGAADCRLETRASG
ncbi:cation transporter [Sphingomonas ginkgonis]|uniref:Cation transporter n=1 Tax=Sphingomonas ginkgonis TaxID=2315330 RepID=A0A429VCJ6_9SPHN|nr:cation diffusion facilitator family transporter [Sphingomonas ginkgonis]RST31606.1 cation transporter [Sphingomonas ginkgonis]